MRPVQFSRLPVSRALIRQLLRKTLFTAEQLDAFCLDYFPSVQELFAGGMNRLSKTNLLLELAAPNSILEQLTVMHGEAAIKQTLATIPPSAEIVQGPEVDALRDELDRLYGTRARLRITGHGTQSVDEEILQIKRRQRERPQLREGEVLNNRFRLLEIIGRGGFAKVWLAMDLESRTFVAVKVLHVDLSEDHSRLERFRRGAVQIMGLSHPYLIRIIDGPTEEYGFHYYTMELMAGGDIHNAIINRQIDRTAALRALLQAGEAVDYAHQNGLIHRDIKPQNILLDLSGCARITDFDLVMAADSTGGTHTGAMGTFLYAAPEQMNDVTRVDCRADVYSLAMTAMFILCGRPLTTHDILRRLEFISGIDCNAALRDILRAATAIDPPDRPSSILEMCRQLEMAIDPITATLVAYPEAIPLSISTNSVEPALRPAIKNRWPWSKIGRKARYAIVGCLLSLMASSFGFGIYYYKIQQPSRRELLSPDDGCLMDKACRKEYDAAVQLFESGRFLLAYKSFRSAFEIRQVPWLLINIGRSAHRMGRAAEALDCYKLFKRAEAHPDSETMTIVKRYEDQAEALLRDLPTKASIASCALATEPN